MGLPGGEGGGVPHQICKEEREQKAAIPAAAVAFFTTGMLMRDK